VSPRRNVLQFVGILAALAMLGALIAGPASAKRMTSKQKAHVRSTLRKQVKKNPKVVSSKSFLKKASLVNFTLPVTIRLRGSSAATNPNNANIDLGPSLGQREIDLGGKLAAEIVFADSFDGGALGNVKLNILPSTTKSLTSTSIPLLWNTQVSDSTTNFGGLGTGTRWDANLLEAVVPGASVAAGCSNFSAAAAAGSFYAPGSPGHLPFGPGIISANGAPGVPFYDTLTPDPAVVVPTTASGYLPVKPGVDDINNLAASKVPGDDNNLGGNPNPFPASAPFNPGGTPYAPSVKDAVLRTNALSLNIADSGIEVNQSNGTGPTGSSNVVTGKSGGEANLFGNIPGKSYGIDVTVNLATKINSIFRIVDQDSFGAPLFTGNRYPAGIFGCRQIWSGAVQNYIPSVHLVGSLKISPGITSDGFLRIAKATIKTPNTGTATADKARVALAACLAPYAGFAAQQGTSDTTASAIPPYTSIAAPYGLVPDSNLGLPADPNTKRNAPSGTACNAPPTRLVQDSALTPALVAQQVAANAVNGYTTTADGSRVSVAGDLDVKNVSVDVLIGDH
jgi:hypothetical protein